jgi:hypothetical protein
MASFPGAKVHRIVTTRRLTRGAVSPLATIPVAVSNPSADVMQLTTTVDCVWSRATLSTCTAVGATVVSVAILGPTEVQITFSASIAAAAWTVPTGCGTSQFGGQTLPASGTF